MKLDAEFNEPDSAAGGTWVTEAKADAAEIGPDMIDFVVLKGDAAGIDAALFADVDDSLADAEAAGFVDASDSCCTSRLDTVSAAPEVGRASSA